LIVLTASFQLNWPDFVEDLLEVQEAAGTAPQQVLSFECSLQDGDIDANVFFQKLVIFNCLPIIAV
jgi:hypothetical protein